MEIKISAEYASFQWRFHSESLCWKSRIWYCKLVGLKPRTAQWQCNSSRILQTNLSHRVFWLSGRGQVLYQNGRAGVMKKVYFMLSLKRHKSSGISCQIEFGTPRNPIFCTFVASFQIEKKGWKDQYWTSSRSTFTCNGAWRELNLSCGFP
jgi:hypothetical protein